MSLAWVYFFTSGSCCCREPSDHTRNTGEHAAIAGIEDEKSGDRARRKHRAVHQHTATRGPCESHRGAMASEKAPGGLPQASLVRTSTCWISKFVTTSCEGTRKPPTVTRSHGSGCDGACRQMTVRTNLHFVDVLAGGGAESQHAEPRRRRADVAQRHAVRVVPGGLVRCSATRQAHPVHDAAERRRAQAMRRRRATRPARPPAACGGRGRR